MKRLTEYTIPETGFTVVPEEKYKRILMDEKPSVEKVYNRLKKIEDILGDDYDLDCLRELAEADREGRCVVLDGKSRDKELIRKLVRLFYWLEDCIKKKDFSPFRRVAGAPENNYPFISAFQRIENEYELEIQFAGKDEAAEAALAKIAD